MTRKDYKLIAEALNESFQNFTLVTMEEILQPLMSRLQGDNASFDRDKFRRAVLGE
jgi:hypothetical protein